MRLLLLLLKLWLPISPNIKRRRGEGRVEGRGTSTHMMTSPISLLVRYCSIPLLLLLLPLVGGGVRPIVRWGSIIVHMSGDLQIGVDIDIGNSISSSIRSSSSYCSRDGGI